MIALLQRVSDASVTVNQKIIGEIGKGLLVLVAVEPQDTEESVKRLANKVAKYRIFADENGKMNLNVAQAGGDILAVSQFTLAADTSRGLRPSFTSAASPELGEQLYQYFCLCLRELGFKVPTGEFGADMKVALTNDGPVTIYLKG
ncbi:D-tyrosyl-tRNA(Tyr) deacylase [Thalassotalea sp. LPB0316]|uniref:D-aminoacyl-tRNA deacylase n=1 Tax=Thalassotalea sp. LPB0316 TaxID=2769490 RepID=UPI00186881CF|nr:D-aminoacyl-tRNA deacylase [Thalassotalea sp. LPB0316]QOL26011.1 D-tyrosyl-tRNA(Tyr) deacylase [Thalassotalea sp. LPB0316]